MSLSAGQLGILKRRHVRGERTRVSQAAMVRVQTRKYLCAERCGGRLSSLGRVRVGTAIVGAICTRGAVI